MKHLFVPYEIALALKEKGFDEPCFGEYQQWDGSVPDLTIYQDMNEECTDPYTTECAAPLYQQVIDWFRERHNLIVRTNLIGYDINTHYWEILDINDKSTTVDSRSYKDPNKALTEAINHAIKLLP